MTTPMRNPLVESALAFEIMETDAIGLALKAHGWSVGALGPRTIVGARPVSGEPETTTREVAFWRIPGSSAWAGCLNQRFPHPRGGQVTSSHLNAPGARYPAFTTRLITHIRWIREVAELDAWLTKVEAL